MESDDACNLNPTPETRFAMLLWGKRYSEQNGGSMDFWDSLSASEQTFCREGIEQILKAHRAHGRPIKTPMPAFSRKRS